MRARGTSLAFGLLWFGILAPAAAQSLFSREGLGEWFEGYDLAAEARGSTSIGVIDPYGFGTINPASPAFATLPVGYAGLQGSLNWSDDGTATSRQSSGLISGVGGMLPLGSRLGLRLSVRPRTDATYFFEEVIETGSGASGNIHRDEGARGLLFYGADLAWRGSRRFALGLNVGLQTGSILDENTYTFSDSGWTGTQDRRLLRFRPAWTLGGGLQWSPYERLALGAVLTGGQSMKIEEIFTSTGEAEWTRELRMDGGYAVGGGLSFFLGPHLRASGDLFWRSWEDVRLDEETLPQSAVAAFRNTLRWGVGIERTPRTGRFATWSQRLALRAGFAWIPWQVHSRGAAGVDEYRITAGVGIPIRGDRGRLDTLICYGHRGALDENGLAEEYLRLGFACTFASTMREY